MNRREFLVKGGAAAAALAAAGAAREQSPPPLAAPSSAPDVTIPPPFGRTVYQSRMEAARALMRSVKAEALVETPGANLRFLTGLDIARSERLIAFVLPLEDPPVILGPMLERDRLAASPAGVEDVVTWEEDESSYAALEKILKKAGVGDKRIAIGGKTWYDDFQQLNEKLPKLTFVSATAIVGYLREHKSPDEIECMRCAIAIVEHAIDLALKEAREGVREKELHGRIIAGIQSMGADGDGLVQFGPRSAVPHNPTSDRPLASGDVILVDFGAQVNGYWSDISRPAVLGKATGRMKVIHAAIRQAQDLSLERARPDAPCAALDLMSRATLGSHGFSRFQLHRLGHGIGLEGHEPPWLTNGNYEKLAIGNVATLEPGVYTPGDYGIRIEDMMEVTAQGGRLLSHPPSTLLEL